MGVDPLVDARGFVNSRGSRQGELSRYHQCGCNFAELECLTLTFAAQHSQALALGRQRRTAAVGGHDESGQCDGKIKVAFAGSALKGSALIRLADVRDILTHR